MQDNINDFTKEIEVIYKNEKYTVRDNGAILRHSEQGKRVRPLDDVWTFGKPNKMGYMIHSSARVHIIVNIAFNGEPPSKQHIVDHIDTNRQNNRPDNLRWVTKLENALGNPITRRKIILICGSIEAFLKNPKCIGDSEYDPNFSWMRRVNPKEAQVSLKKLLEWAEQDKKPKGLSIGDWIFGKSEQEQYTKQVKICYTEGIEQRNWSTRTDFPYCPDVTEAKPIRKYFENLSIGLEFAHNRYGSSNVLKTSIVDEDNTLYVMTEFIQAELVKPYALAKVTFENRTFIHEAIRTYFTLEGAEKEFTIAQGLEWNGGDTFDDYC